MDGSFCLGSRLPDWTGSLGLAALRRPKAVSVPANAHSTKSGSILPGRPLDCVRVERVREKRSVRRRPWAGRQVAGLHRRGELSSPGGIGLGRDGKEIFYLAPDKKLMAAAVNGQVPPLRSAPCGPCFDTRAVLDHHAGRTTSRPTASASSSTRSRRRPRGADHARRQLAGSAEEIARRGAATLDAERGRPDEVWAACPLRNEPEARCGPPEDGLLQPALALGECGGGRGIRSIEIPELLNSFERSTRSIR